MQWSFTQAGKHASEPRKEVVHIVPGLLGALMTRLLLLIKNMSESAFAYKGDLEQVR